MADPVSVVASITGLLAFTAKITREIITLISEVRDAPEEITDLKFELQNLSSLIRSAHDLVTRNQLQPDDKPLEDTTTECLEQCRSILTEIGTKLKPFVSSSSGRRSPLPQSWSWVLHKGRIRNLQDRLRNSRAMLELSITVLSAHLVGKGQHEVMDEMARGMERLGRQFQSSKNAKKLQRRLRGDLESVSGSSISDQTDTDFPRRKLLGEHTYDDTASLVPSSTVVDSEGTALLQVPQMNVVEDVPALLRAAQAGNVQQVKALLSLGASPGPRLPDGRTPLHFCAVYDDVVTAETLITYGADINARDEKRRSPFWIAITSQSFGVAELLLRRGSVFESFVPMLLDTIRAGEDGAGAGFSDFLAALRQRLENSQGPHLLHEAIEYGDDAALEALLKGGFDPNSRDMRNISPIHHAIIRQRKASVKLLLRHGANPDDFLPPETLELLQVDSISWHRSLLPPMLDCGITPLGTAGRAMHDIDMVRLLLEAGANPNYEHSDGGLVTMGLCIEEYFEIHKVLIDSGADVNRKNHSGFTAIYCAVTYGSLNLVRYMLDRGADVSTVCEPDCHSTMLHLAIRHQNEAMAKLLIQRGADLHAQDEFGRTPLQLVEVHGDCNVKELMERKMALRG
ncbi:ankyrin repeat-containing domain protein [Lasiosphaeria hispida]|uniref:Ankyrin repeat-containing domain protein n=1 Tax=Lasiosphaeria hispida TaxID=260671 RepID=A0AAJ0M9B5_9PEZI|nr:ankyrin repeat-containing domain protein [Lasiosphaeria hispida]